MKPASIFLCVLLSWTAKTVKPINAVRETAMGSRSPAGPRRLGTATRMNASLSRRLSAFFGNTPDQGQKAAKFAVLNPAAQGFRTAQNAPRVVIPPPSKTPRVSPCKPLCARLGDGVACGVPAAVPRNERCGVCASMIWNRAGEDFPTPYGMHLQRSSGRSGG